MILHAALELIMKQGLQATPMSQIAAAARTGMGTIYNYFTSKEDLVCTLYKKARITMDQVILWGTFNLSLHEWTEPIERLLQSAAEHNVSVITPKAGEHYQVGNALPAERWWRKAKKSTLHAVN